MSRITQWLGRLRPGLKLVLLLLPIIVLMVALVTINTFLYMYPNSTQFSFLNDNKVSLTFDGKSSFHDGNLELLVDNNQKGSPKILNVYGLDRDDQISKSSSYLVDDTHKINTYTMLTLASNNPGAIPRLYYVTIPILEFPGSYNGWIFVSGKDNMPIPVTITTEPKIVQALLWVVIGILGSIFFWELINYINQIKKAQTETQTTIQNEPSKMDDILKETKTTKEAVMDFMQNASGNLANVNHKSIKQYLDKETRKRLEIHINRNLASKAFVKVSIIDLGTILFGIAVSFLALLSQGYVTTLRVIGPLEILALVGLGLGIGSLREILNKD